MADTALSLLIEGPYKPTIFTNYNSNDSSITTTFPTDHDTITAVDDEIPTIDYFTLFSDDPKQRSLAIKSLTHACEDYGFFYVCISFILFTLISYY